MELLSRFLIFNRDFSKEKDPILPISTLSMNLRALNSRSNVQYISGKYDKYLTPSLDGTRYYTSGIWQKVLLIIYGIAEEIFGRHLFAEKDRKVKEITDFSCKQITKDLLLARNTYLQHLNFLYGEGFAPEESKYKESIRTITSWNQWIFPRLNNTMEHWNEFQEIRELQHLISLEQILGGAKCRLPIEYLIQLAQKDSRLEKEEKEQYMKLLNPWITGVNEKIKSVLLPKKTHLLQVTTFHRALHILIDLYTQRNCVNRADVIKKQRDLLEKHLNALGCKLMLVGDETQENFRKKVYQQKKIKIDGNVLKLGKPLGVLSFDFKDTFHVYPLVWKEKNCVLLIPANPCVISRQRLYYEQHTSKIPFIPCFYEDYWGRFKICPTMSSCLKDYKWTSIDKLDIEDKKIVLKIATLVKSLIQGCMTPTKLDIKKFFFDDEKELISIFAYTSAPYDYCRLENFVLEAANGNPLVFKHIMIESGLTKMQEHTFFNNVVLSASNKPSISKEEIFKLLKGKTKILDIETQKKLVDEGLEVIDKITDQRNRILKCVENHNINNTLAQENIQKIYLQEYDQWNYGCNLPDHLVADVIKKYNDEYNNEKKN